MQWYYIFNLSRTASGFSTGTQKGFNPRSAMLKNTIWTKSVYLIEYDVINVK